MPVVQTSPKEPTGRSLLERHAQNDVMLLFFVLFTPLLTMVNAPSWEYQNYTWGARRGSLYAILPMRLSEGHADPNHKPKAPELDPEACPDQACETRMATPRMGSALSRCRRFVKIFLGRGWMVLDLHLGLMVWFSHRQVHLVVLRCGAANSNTSIPENKKILEPFVFPHHSVCYCFLALLFAKASYSCFGVCRVIQIFVYLPVQPLHSSFGFRG